MGLCGLRSRSRTRGTLIENIQCRFESGKIVEAKASAGEDVLNRLISTDEGAAAAGRGSAGAALVTNCAEWDSVLEHVVR